MKINVNNIQAGGLELEEGISPKGLDLETGIIKFSGPLNAKAEVYKITNVVTVHLTLSGLMQMICSRCLNEFTLAFKKALQLNYTVDKPELMLDLEPDIRQEIILGYPIKPLCCPECKGLCSKCGKNLNEGICVHSQ